MLTVDSGCVAWPAYKPTPTTWTSKLSQKLSSYMRVYTVLLLSKIFLTSTLGNTAYIDYDILH